MMPFSSKNIMNITSTNHRFTWQTTSPMCWKASKEIQSKRKKTEKYAADVLSKEWLVTLGRCDMSEIKGLFFRNVTRIFFSINYFSVKISDLPYCVSMSLLCRNCLLCLLLLIRTCLMLKNILRVALYLPKLWYNLEKWKQLFNVSSQNKENVNSYCYLHTSVTNLFFYRRNKYRVSEMYLHTLKNN